MSGISNETKNQILGRAKEGVPVLTLSKEHGVSVKTIYGWLAHLPGRSPSLVEYGKLKERIIHSKLKMPPRESRQRFRQCV